MKQRILLLFPNTSNDGVVPLAIAILSAIAKRLEFDVQYFETSFYEKRNSATEERERTGEFKTLNRKSLLGLFPYERLKKDFYELLESYKPDILAVSANSLEYTLFCELLEGFQSIQPKPFVIVGGVEATVAPDDVIANPYVDAICIGEGEKAWEEFLIKSQENQDITTIQNFWVKDGSKVIKNSLRSLLPEDVLWTYPLDFSFFNEKHFAYVFDGKKYLKGNIELSRGCPYSCTYCANSAFKRIYKGLGKFMRVRPLDNVKSAIKQLVEFGCEMLYFQDESFLSIPYPVLKAFSEWYREEIRQPLLLMARPESVTDKKAKLLADIGVPVQVSLGIESGSERVLRDICNRRTMLKDIKNAVNVLKKYNLRITAYTMIGFPTETRQEVFETIFFVRSCDLDASVMSIFFPFKGIPLRDYCIEHGYISGNERARTFTDASILKNQPMSKEEITSLRRVYALYTKLPEEYFPKIELCERDYENHSDLFNELVDLVHNSYYRSWKLK